MVRFEYLNLSVLAAPVDCREDGRVLQKINALVHPWQLIFIPYGHRAKRSVVGRDMQLFVFVREKFDRVCPVRYCGLDHVFVERPANLLAFVSPLL